MNISREPIQINVKEIFKEKNSRLYKILPGFFFRYLKNIVHESQLNYILREHSHKSGIGFLNSTLDYFDAEARVRGPLDFPDESGIIIAANHPLGSLDGMLLIKKVYEKYGSAKALVNDMLMNLEPLKEFFIGFNKHGSTARDIIKELNQLLEDDCPVIYFPSGMVSRKYGKKIYDAEWKKSFISNAVYYKKNVLPVHISGRLSESFYRKAKLRRNLGINMNIEMLYLPHELFKLNNPNLEFTIGKKLSHEIFDKSKSSTEWAEEVRKYVYRLEKNPDAKFHTNE